TVTFAAMPGDSRAEMMRLGADLRAIRDVELPPHVAGVRGAVGPVTTRPDTDPDALRAADSLLILPSDPAAATEEILRRREESGFSYIVVGAHAADALAPVVAELTGHLPVVDKPVDESVEINSSTSVSVISRSRQYNSAASSV